MVSLFKCTVQSFPYLVSCGRQLSRPLILWSSHPSLSPDWSLISLASSTQVLYPAGWKSATVTTVYIYYSYYSLHLLQSTVSTVYSYYSDPSNKPRNKFHATVKHLWKQVQAQGTVHATVKHKWNHPKLQGTKTQPITTDHAENFIEHCLETSYCVPTLQVEYIPVVLSPYPM